MPLLILDLLGVAVFAISGALAATRARMDVFGVAVLGMITALGGGVVRDVLLGITPPSTLRQWPYLLVAGLAALAATLLAPAAKALPSTTGVLRRTFLVADALGLALFATTGTATGLAAGAPTVTACLVGVISGIGGGMARDVLLRQVPMVLHREVYALPAVLGAATVAGGMRLGWPATPVLLASAALVAGLRLLAIWRNWDAPRPRR